MQYSPKLKKAMEEIKDILSRYDVAGLVVIHTPGHTEFLNKLDPTYSCCRQIGDQIRVKTRLDDFSGSVTARNKAIEDTSNMLHGLCKVTGTILLPLMDISSAVDKVVDADHTAGGFSSHSAQNN